MNSTIGNAADEGTIGSAIGISTVISVDRQKVLSQLPISYAESFGSLGYHHYSDNDPKKEIWPDGRPSQILSPFEVPAGNLRQQWIDKFIEVRYW